MPYLNGEPKSDAKHWVNHSPVSPDGSRFVFLHRRRSPGDRAHYASIAPHNPFGPIFLAAGVQLAAATPEFLCQEQVGLGAGYLKTPFRVSEGCLDLPGGPGLGIELDGGAIAEKLGRDWKNRETRDMDDGSVVDW